MAGFVGLESVGAHVDRLNIFIVKSLAMKAAQRLRKLQTNRQRDRHSQFQMN